MIDKATMQKIIDEQDYELLAKELAAIKKLIDNCRKQKYTNIDFASASIEGVSQVTGRRFNT
jgi:hypothetical protein